MDAKKLGEGRNEDVLEPAGAIYNGVTGVDYDYDLEAAEDQRHADDHETPNFDLEASADDELLTHDVEEDMMECDTNDSTLTERERHNQVPINPNAVAREFLRLMQQHFFFEDDDSEPSDQDTKLAFELVMQIVDRTSNSDQSTEDEYDMDPEYTSEQDESPKSSSHSGPSLEQKKKFINYTIKHPGHKFKTLTKLFRFYKKENQLKIWREQIQSGGTRLDKLEQIEKRTFDQFKQARSSFKRIRSTDIRGWALQEAKTSYPDFKFVACNTWLGQFVKKYRLSCRKVQKNVNRRDIENEDVLKKKATDFAEIMKECGELTPKRWILNTDQAGVQYETWSARTYTFKNEKVTYGHGWSPKNAATHSFTIQPVIGMDGTLFPVMYVCLQEPAGKMSDRVKKTLPVCPNLSITCSASGKLTKTHMRHFLKTVIEPHVTDDFILTLDSWTGHTQQEHYDHFGKNGLPRCRVEIIPAGTTGYCQPLDTGFNRQFKETLRSLSDHAALYLEKRLTDRNSVLYLASLVHFVLIAPRFKPLIQHCFAKAGWLNEKDVPDHVFVKGFCFKDLGKYGCAGNGEVCNGAVCIRCPHCELFLCFDHFFVSYHVLNCRESPWHAACPSPPVEIPLKKSKRIPSKSRKRAT